MGSQEKTEGRKRMEKSREGEGPRMRGVRYDTGARCAIHLKTGKGVREQANGGDGREERGSSPRERRVSRRRRCIRAAEKVRNHKKSLRQEKCKKKKGKEKFDPELNDLSEGR